MADEILFVRRGDFLESYDQDAETVSRVCGLTLTKERKTGRPMCGIPVWSMDERFAELAEAGFNPVNASDDQGSPQ